MNPETLKELSAWIIKNCQNDFGTLTIEIKLRNGKPVHVNRSFIESIFLDDPKKGGANDNRNR